MSVGNSRLRPTTTLPSVAAFTLKLVHMAAPRPGDGPCAGRDSSHAGLTPRAPPLSTHPTRVWSCRADLVGARSRMRCRSMIGIPENIYGGGGIRTHGTCERSTVFKTVAFDLSATPPGHAVPGGNDSRPISARYGAAARSAPAAPRAPAHRGARSRPLSGRSVRLTTAKSSTSPQTPARAGNGRRPRLTRS